MFKSSSFDLKILITKVKIAKDVKQSCIHHHSVCRHEREHGLNMACPRSSNMVYPLGFLRRSLLLLLNVICFVTRHWQSYFICLGVKVAKASVEIPLKNDSWAGNVEGAVLAVVRVCSFCLRQVTWCLLSCSRVYMMTITPTAVCPQRVSHRLNVLSVA